MIIASNKLSKLVTPKLIVGFSLTPSSLSEISKSEGFPQNLMGPHFSRPPHLSKGLVFSQNVLLVGVSVTLHWLYVIPEYWFIPIIPKSKNINDKNITTEPSLGIDMNSVDTSIRILGIALIDLKGLKTRKTLSDFRLGTLGKNSTNDTKTTIKSKTFHPSLIYEFLWVTKPIAIIFKAASTININVKHSSK